MLKWSTCISRRGSLDRVGVGRCLRKEGEFIFRLNLKGQELTRHSYVYHYSESTDKIDVWFAKSDYKTSDYFFHELKFLIPARRDGELQPWRAKSSHLCKLRDSERNAFLLTRNRHRRSV